MNLYIIILWAVSAALAITTAMNGGDNSAFVAATLVVAAIGVRGKS